MSNPDLIVFLILVFCCCIVGAGLASALARAFWD